MTHSQMAWHALQDVLIKHLADQAHVFVETNAIPFKHSNASGFLTSVLQGIEPEITEAGNLLTCSKHAKDPAGLLHPIRCPTGLFGPLKGHSS